MRQLDDRIYCLQQTNLPTDLSTKLQEADRLYLRDSDAEAEKLVDEIESTCEERRIAIHQPSFHVSNESKGDWY